LRNTKAKPCKIQDILERGSLPMMSIAWVFQNSGANVRYYPPVAQNRTDRNPPKVVSVDWIFTLARMDIKAEFILAPRAIVARSIFTDAPASTESSSSLVYLSILSILSIGRGPNEDASHISDGCEAELGSAAGRRAA
jgi:hypothetical protein